MLAELHARPGGHLCPALRHLPRADLGQQRHLGGDAISGPILGREEILYAGIDLAAVHEPRRMFDPVGHHPRPDAFTLHVNTRAQTPVVFDGEARA